MMHQVAEIVDAPAVVAVCTCGWRSTPALTHEHAQRRWSIHVGQHRSASCWEHAWRINDSARARAGELVGMRELARWRRSSLAQRRAELRQALERARQAPRPAPQSAERTVECARQLAGLSVMELWLRVYAYGCQLSVEQLQAVVDGREQLAAPDYDVVATVLNEVFADAGFGSPLPFRVMA